MAYAILGNPKPAFFDTNGAPYVGGTITVQNPSNSAAKNSYPTAADADADTNGVSTAITLDARGEPTSTQLWGRDNEDYKIILKDSAGSTIYTLNEIQLGTHPNGNATFTIGTTDASPAVADGYFGSITDGTTDIVNFDEGYSGKIIVVHNSGTTARRIDHNTEINLKDVADGGIALIKDDTIVFARDSTTWHEIGRKIAGPVLQVAEADQTTSADDTLTDDSYLAGYQLAPESFYKVTGHIKCNPAASSTPDIKLALQTDNAFQDAYWTILNVNDAGTDVADAGVPTTAITTALVANQVHTLTISGQIQTHATAISTVDLQWAQGTSDAAVLTVELGSWLQFELIRSD